MSCWASGPSLGQLRVVEGVGGVVLASSRIANQHLWRCEDLV